MHKRSLKGNLQRSKRSLNPTKVNKDEVIKLNILKTRRLVRGKNLLGATLFIIIQRRRKREACRSTYLVALFHPYSSLLSCNQRFEINVDEEDSKTKPKEETHRREIRQKKRQERAEEGSSSRGMSQIIDMISSL
ncbi:hypothetical protein M9H77_02941 [Catharanthus roseus]|uniref:Uncharacterized protein n=1 Tax=Catharanthus roseus TaxID=4058 RepID=A0ACC0C9Q8_CATRO|nr:hypothetical protein M9H77_02941 [Catharanthus roseus]